MNKFKKSLTNPLIKFFNPIIKINLIHGNSIQFP